MTPRRGFSLIELLVVISVLSFLVALLLPAVQVTRARMERLSCQSNLRQIGMAIHSYESAHGRLPPAFRHQGPQVQLPHLMWPILIAEQIGQGNSLRQAEEDYKNHPDPIHPTPHRGLSQPIKTFSCPSDWRMSRAWPVTFYYTLAKPKRTLVSPEIAMNSYLGNAGEQTWLKDGVMIADGHLSMSSIKDGLSQTILAGERPPSANLLRGWLYTGWGAIGWRRGNGEFESVMGVRDSSPFPGWEIEKVCGTGPYPFRQPDLNFPKDCAMFQYWSYHTGGANFVFCDGSVHFLKYAANPNLPALATRAGGESVTISD